MRLTDPADVIWTFPIITGNANPRWQAAEQAAQFQRARPVMSEIVRRWSAPEKDDG
jgi:hypothetical protein